AVGKSNFLDLFEHMMNSRAFQESDLTLESLEAKLSHLLSHKDQYQASMKASTELKSLADFYDLLRKDLA
ncbi:MAG: hypothetical protein E7J13_07335, partial [Streptococcus sp.]|nr:hypothetical protein [Streptococcus sp.]